MQYRPSFFKRTQSVLRTYAEKLFAFSRNARFYLLSTILTGASLGVYRLLFNFYVLSMKYDEALLGALVTTSSMTALICALPMGYLADTLGRKRSLVLGGIGAAVSVACIALWPSVPMFFAMNVLLGMAQSLSGVSMGPFLMENSTDKERTYLFSFSSGFQTMSGFFGNWIGGVMPTWLSTAYGFGAESTEAYGWSLLIIAAGAMLGVLPLLLLRTPHLSSEQRSLFAPFAYFKKAPGQLGKLILPMLVTSIGAGMFMPFMNVFFRQVHHLPDPTIGTMFAWGSLAMGIGLILAPPIADKIGKIQLVVLTQGISIPFLILLGFSPWFLPSAVGYYVRLALMNMSGPVYQTFVMEHVDPSARGTVASLVSMANNFGWAFSPSISGYLQVNYGFQPVYGVVLVLYSLTVYLYWSFFWKPNKKTPAAIPAE